MRVRPPVTVTVLTGAGGLWLNSVRLQINACLAPIVERAFAIMLRAGALGRPFVPRRRPWQRRRFRRGGGGPLNPRVTTRCDSDYDPHRWLC